MDNRTPVWQSTKKYTHAVGLSCCYRNWRADSHCAQLHGYSLQVSFEFEATELDERNFVVDFGGLKNLKGWLEETFDHKCLVASDDPYINMYREMDSVRVITMREVPEISCERFAEMIYEYTEQWLKDAGFSPRCQLASVRVDEHGANGAVFFKR